MEKGYPVIVRMSQSEFDAGKGAALDNERIEISNPTGEKFFNSGAAGVAPVAEVTAANINTVMATAGGAGWEKTRITTASYQLKPLASGASRDFHIESGGSLATLVVADWPKPTSPQVDVFKIRNFSGSAKTFQVSVGVGQFAGIVTADGDAATPAATSYSIRNDGMVVVSIDSDGWVQVVPSTEISPSEFNSALAGKSDAGHTHTVSNVLTSTSTVEALSAAQGKILKDTLDVARDPIRVYDPETESLPRVAHFRPDDVIEATGVSVGSWADAAENAGAVTQATAASKPTVSATLLNSLKVLTFDGGDQLSGGVSKILKNIGIFAVVKPATGSSGIRTLIGSGAASGLQVALNASHQLKLTQQNTAEIAASNVALALNTFAVVGATYSSAGEYEFRTNGVTTGSGTLDKTIVTGVVTVGGRGGEYFNGDIAEVIITAGVPTAAQIATIEGYLAHKFGLTANLPAVHEFKMNKPTPLMVNLAGFTTLETSGTPSANGVAALGTATKAARADHIHANDITKISVLPAIVMSAGYPTASVARSFTLTGEVLDISQITVNSFSGVDVNGTSVADTVTGQYIANTLNTSVLGEVSCWFGVADGGFTKTVKAKFVNSAGGINITLTEAAHWSGDVLASASWTTAGGEPASKVAGDPIATSNATAAYGLESLTLTLDTLKGKADKAAVVDVNKPIKVYSSSSAYPVVGTLVSFNDVIYRSITAIATAEVFTASRWVPVTERLFVENTLAAGSFTILSAGVYTLGHVTGWGGTPTPIAGNAVRIKVNNVQVNENLHTTLGGSLTQNDDTFVTKLNAGDVVTFFADPANTVQKIDSGYAYVSSESGTEYSRLTKSAVQTLLTGNEELLVFGTASANPTGIKADKVHSHLAVPAAKSATFHITTTALAITEALHNDAEIHFEGTANATINATAVTSDTFGFTLINTDAGVDRTLTPTGFGGVFLRDGNSSGADLGNVAFTIKDNQKYRVTVTVSGGSKYLNIETVNLASLQGAIDGKMALYQQGHPFHTAAAQAGHIATSSSDFSAAFAGWRAFQAAPTASDEWATAGQATGSLTYQLPQPTIFNRVVLKGRDSGVEYPTTWSVEGSNDGSTYTALVASHVQSLLTEQTVDFANVVAYKYYRFSYTVGTGTNIGLNRIRYYHTGINYLPDSLTSGLINALFETVRADGVSYLADATDIDALLGTGWYNVQNPTGGSLPAGWYYLFTSRHRNATSLTSNYGFQLAKRLESSTLNNLFMRTLVNGTWQVWTEIATKVFNGVRTTTNVAQSIATGSTVAVTWPTEAYDTTTYHDPTTNPTRLTAAVAGYYRIGASITFAANATGERAVGYNVSGGSAVWVVDHAADPTAQTAQSFSTELYLAAGAYVEILAYQTSGAALNVTTASFATLSYLGS